MAKQAKLIKKLFGYLKISLMVIISAMTLAGCCPSLLEADYGAAVTYNETVQIARPEAGYCNYPAVGMSPTAAVKTLESYDKSFERKAQQPQAPYATFLNMGVSSSK